MAEIKLIATDIDGTIMKHNFEFNPEIVEFIKKLTKDGIKVVLVTGRMYSATDFIAEQLGLDTPVVCYQGGLIKKGDNVLYEKNLDPKNAKEIIAWARENHVHINLYLNDELFVEEDSEVIKRYTRERNAEYKVKSFDELELTMINKILAIDFEDYKKVSSWIDYLTNRFPELYVVKSTPFFCEISHPQARKSCAVDFLKQYWNLKTEEVLTIGDQNNDIELLKAGGIKVAMGNATDELKQVADYITDSVNNNGFIKAIEKFVYYKIE